MADPFYPFGRNDQQEVVAYLCHTAQPGCRADLNVLAAPTLREVLRLQQPPGWVVRGGKVLARNQVVRTLEQ